MKQVKRLASLGVAVGIALAAAPASAVEHENQIGVELGGAMLQVSGRPSADIGGTLGLHYSYGLSDAFNLIAEGGWSLVSFDKVDDPSTPRNRPGNLFNMNVGLAYVFDVVRWVPWAGVLVGGYALDGGTIEGTRFLPGAIAAVGFDYKFTRTWAGGVTLRETFLTDMSSYPTFTQALLRFEYTWGW